MHAYIIYYIIVDKYKTKRNLTIDTTQYFISAFVHNQIAECIESKN